MKTMKVPRRDLIISWTALFFGGIAIGILCTVAYYGEKGKDAHTPFKAHSNPVQTIVEVRVPMSIRELQTFLCEAGHSRYTCDIDGKWGKQTAKALDNYICDRYYKECRK